MFGGWIKLHRQIVDWEFYTDIKTFKLWLHLLLTCNIIPQKRIFGYNLAPGQLATTLPKLAAETGLSEKEVRSGLEKLKKAGQIRQETTNKFRIISIENWELYQGRQTGIEWADKRAANGQTSDSPKSPENQGVCPTDAAAAGRQRADKLVSNGQAERPEEGRRRIRIKEKEFKNKTLSSGRTASGAYGSSGRRNGFINYTQSEWDFEELARLERERNRKWSEEHKEELEQLHEELMEQARRLEEKRRQNWSSSVRS